ncbi:MAG: excinuclease ABC subunit UvrC [Negativicutes bacterium]|jgi:excinuclease ABC subunit C
MTEKLKHKVANLPAAPGVYIYRDAKERIIYIGKAKNLHNRVRSYFRAEVDSPKTAALVERINELEYIVCNSELDALVLECNLIKLHRPHYNIRFKDDKGYSYVKITNDEFPRVLLTRDRYNDGAVYYGPYTDSSAVREMLDLLKLAFAARSCNKMKNNRPCLLHHIGRCLAPCSGAVNRAEYMKSINGIKEILTGKTVQLERQLNEQMLSAAADLQFERAARIRDRLAALNKINEKQQAEHGIDEDFDVIGLVIAPEGTCVQLFVNRNGKILGRENFVLAETDGSSHAEILEAFISSYYSSCESLPKEILLTDKPVDSALLADWLTDKRGNKVRIVVPERGAKKALVDMAVNNAAEYLRVRQTELRIQDEFNSLAARELAKVLGLSEIIRLECFDISHTQGSETVASMVVFREGVPDKKEYRRFKIEWSEGKPDDFLSMYEAVSRRFAKKWARPDLLVIDGGKGQLSAAYSALEDVGITDVLAIGLAKAEEEVFVKNQSAPLVLSRSSKALFLLQRIRDEAHRFAVTYHRQLRTKRNKLSLLDGISGLGQKRKQAIWERFKTIAAMKSASVDDFLQIKGMSRFAAEQAYNFFRNNEV